VNINEKVLGGSVNENKNLWILTKKFKAEVLMKTRICEY
jgi:hypothetical protein